MAPPSMPLNFLDLITINPFSAKLFIIIIIITTRRAPSLLGVAETF